jgi:hypothetical protein
VRQSDRMSVDVGTGQYAIAAVGMPLEVKSMVVNRTVICIRINFQPAGVPVPTGYLADVGAVFGDRGNGYSYGWNRDNSAQSRIRKKNSDPRLDTLILIEKPYIWEIALPNGSYDVTISVGDPGYSTTESLNVEGVNYWDRLSLKIGQHAKVTKTFRIQDGRLTLDSTHAKLNYIEILPHHNMAP